MHPALAVHGQRLEEHVHEHRLAAPDTAPDVEAADRLTVPRREQPAERAGLFRRTISVQALCQSIEPLDQIRLRRIALESSAANQAVVTIGQTRHEIPKVGLRL